MKHRILFLFSVFAFSAFAGAQSMSPQQWDQAKTSGQLDGKAPAALKTANDTTPVTYKLAPNNPNPQPATSSCACWQQRDNTWQIVPITSGSPPDYRNDDGSTAVINIPFNFCLYGTTWTQLYINNNGNVSFGSPYATYTASGFPVNGYAMVAPFWADVDTRNALSGLPYYQVTPTHVIVQWDSVGYFNAYADKVNTFQLIITDGNDPIVPGGNVSFCYKDMQWTTGDASGGTNGFGGSDAVVGANKGDGTNFIQFGEFNQPGGTYNGPATAGSGIDWLDNQSFIFDACTNSNNIPPTISGLSICDTFHLCVGDVLPLNTVFFSPEAGQITNITVDTTGVPGFTIVTNSSGNTATLNSFFTAQTNNTGLNTIIITATDNGTPPATTVIPVFIEVLQPPVTTVSNDTSICLGSPPIPIVATGGSGYTWSPSTGIACDTCGSTTASPTVTTSYVVTIATPACDVHDTVVVTVDNVNANAGNDQTICSGQNVQLNATGGTTYSWSPSTGLNNPNIANPVASPTITTTYTVTATSAIGCTGTDPVTINVSALPNPDFSFVPATVFVDSSFQFTDLSTGSVTSWMWHFGDGDTSTAQNPSHAYTQPGTYHVCLVTVSTNGCSDSVCSDVTVMPFTVYPPNVFTPNGDGINDFLVFKNLEYYPGCMLEVYDRWGMKVYESNSYNNDWNGKRMGTGADVVDGVYYYVLVGPGLDTPVTGFVHVMRGGK
ncbi:MAG TPA: nidogen-like domain-containing protein [Bacteroidia bacterium]|nr:nidogen-like domain-containing protein [Bacteroidia bacterium]